MMQVWLLQGALYPLKHILNVCLANLNGLKDRLRGCLDCLADNGEAQPASDEEAELGAAGVPDAAASKPPGVRVVVFIDDLDRCKPNQIIEVGAVSSATGVVE